MKKISETVVFFGSGPVAAESLVYLAQHFAIEAVVTKPRPAHHKGQVPVLEAASKLAVPVHTVTNRHALDELCSSRHFASQLGILVDFGIIVSQGVIDCFPRGIINSHFSLLPEWRGADPITFAILSGQKRTGVSIMLLTAALDEGPLLAQTPYDLPSNITTPQLTDVLVDISNKTLQVMIPMWLNHQAEAMPQEMVTMAASLGPTYSRKLVKEDGILDWHKSAEQLEREIRAFHDWPKSRTYIADKEVIITAAHVLPGDVASDQPIGKAFRSPTGSLCITAAEGILAIDQLKPAGKPAMSAKAFLAGYGRKFG